jgi:hypothetical protein
VNWEHVVTVPAGCLDGDPGARPALNIFTASKAAWHTIDESIPSFPESAPEEFWRTFMAQKHGGST